MKLRESFPLLATVVFVALSACGGGGGGTTTAPTPAAASSATSSGFSVTCSNGSVQSSSVSVLEALSKCPVPASTVDANLSPGVFLRAVVPAATYTVGSEELAAFNFLNAERQTCGFGLLTQNAKLDQAALAHANWLLINNYGGHYENASVPNGFTGVTPNDRAAAAGYAYSSVTETLESSNSGSLAGAGVSSARGLMAAPYHLFGMMSPYVDVGVSIRSVSQITSLVANGANKRTAAYDFGVPAGGDYQVPSSSAVLTYPCQGTIGTNYQLRNETPSPVPGRDLAALPIGQPILVMVKRGQVLTITGSTMVNAGTGQPVVMRAPLTAANDPNNLLSGYGTYMGLVIPDTPLSQNTQYQVTITGTNNGSAFSRSFSFTTGTGG